MPSRSEKLRTDPPSPQRRRQALEQFDVLLREEAKELAWQHLFDTNPFVLTDALPIRLSGLYRQVSLPSGVADYVFCHERSAGVVGDIGVIELKRPSHLIFGEYSTQHLYRSKPLNVALTEVDRHIDALTRGEFLNTQNLLCVGTRRHAFVIIGRASHLQKRANTPVFRQQMTELVPLGVKLYTFDEIFEACRSNTPPLLHVLLATDSTANKSPLRTSSITRIVNRLGLHARPAMSFVDLAVQFESHVTVRMGSLEV